MKFRGWLASDYHGWLAHLLLIDSLEQSESTFQKSLRLFIVSKFEQELTWI